MLKAVNFTVAQYVFFYNALYIFIVFHSQFMFVFCCDSQNIYWITITNGLNLYRSIV